MHANYLVFSGMLHCNFHSTAYYFLHKFLHPMISNSIVFFFAEITVGFSQPNFSISENDGSVQICAEVLSGHLGTDISLPLQLHIGRSLLTGNNYYVLVCLIWPTQHLGL